MTCVTLLNYSRFTYLAYWQVLLASNHSYQYLFVCLFILNKGKKKVLLVSKAHEQCHSYSNAGDTKRRVRMCYSSFCIGPWFPLYLYNYRTVLVHVLRTRGGLDHYTTCKLTIDVWCGQQCHSRQHLIIIIIIHSHAYYTCEITTFSKLNTYTV
jgi:hypothetical protein